MPDTQESQVAGAASTAAELVNAINNDRVLATEVLRKLPLLVTEDGEVPFNINPTVNVPSIKMLQDAAAGGQINQIADQVNSNSRNTINLISEVVRLATAMGKERINPGWRPVNLTDSSIDADTSNALYKASVDYGLRFPYEAVSERRPEYKTESVGSVIGDWLIPNHTEKTIERTLGDPTSATDGAQSLSYDDLYKRAEIKVNTTKTYHPPKYAYYGGYWRWRHFYYWDNWYLGHYGYWQPGYRVQISSGYTSTHTSTTTQYTEPTIESLDGQYAMVAQTLYLPRDHIMLGITIQVDNYDQQVANAAPKYYLVRTAQGVPLTDDVIATGVANKTNRAHGGKNEVKITWNQPVFLRANEQVAVIIAFKNTYQVQYITDTDRSGGLFVSQDHYYWSPHGSQAGEVSLKERSSYQRIYINGQSESVTVYRYSLDGGAASSLSDLCYNVIVAEFDASEYTLELKNYELSGGISSAALAVVAQNESDIESGNIEFEVYVNSEWQPLSVLDNDISLPPNVQARLKLSGSQHVMPLLDKNKTVVTLSRPASSMRFVTKERTKSADTVRIVYELAGYKKDVHTVAVKLIADTEEIEPTLSVADDTQSSDVKTIRSEFALPPSVTSYRIKIEGSTLNASVMFDVTSLIELL